MVGLKSAAKDVVEREHHLCDIAFQEAVCDAEIVVIVKDVQVFYDFAVGDVPLCVRCELVEDAECIAHAAIRFLCNDVECFVLACIAFAFCHPFQMSDDVLHLHTVEVVNLAS